MNNRPIITLLASTLIFISGAVSASSEGKSYIGVQYGNGNYSDKEVSKDFKPEPAALIGRFGYYFRPGFSVEGRLGVGLEDDTQFLKEFGLNGLNAKFELDSILGVYGTAHFNLLDAVSLYGLLGVTRVEATASVPGFPEAGSTDEKSGFSYGFGADFSATKSLLVNIEYMRYLEKTNYDLDVLGAGVSFLF